MNNPRCAVCGHVSRLGVAECELCNTRFDASAAPGPFGARTATGEPSAAGAEPFGGFGGSAREGALPTDIPSPRFLGLGDVASPTLRVYREHFVLLGQLVLATMLPLAVLQCVAYALIQSDEWAEVVSGPGASSFFLAGGAAGGAVYWLLILFGNAVLTGALACAVVQLQRRGAARAGDCLRWGLAKMFKVVAVTLLSSLLIYVAPAVVLMLLGAVLGPVVFLGVAALILPWIILVVTISLAVPAATVENRGVLESFRRSAELTRGFKGLLFLTYFCWWALILGLKFGLSWSFSYGGELSLAGLVVQTLVEGMLGSSMTVLTLYIFLGVLNERRQAAAAPPVAPAPVI